MRKMIVLVAAAMTLLASQAFATNADLTKCGGFHPSTGVTTVATLNGTVDAWGAVAAHVKGDKQYATTSAWGGIAWTTVPVGTVPTAADTVPNTSTDSTAPSGSVM